MNANSIMHLARLIMFAFFLTVGATPSAEAQMPKWKQVHDCSRSGAYTSWLMTQCMGGMAVSAREFEDCVTGRDDCLGDAPRPIAPPVNGRSGGGITAIGPDGELFVHVVDSRGQKTSYVYLPLAEWDPSLTVSLPPSMLSVAVSSGALNAQIKFALPAIPELRAADTCRRSATNESQFMQCLVERALPPQYRMVRSCVERHSNDMVLAAICSSGDSALQDTYIRAKQVQACAANSSGTGQLVSCLGTQGLGTRERQWADCVSRNSSDMTLAAICGLSADLTPEQQIAVSCASKTGGNPKAFAVCVGGQLVAREIQKCWQGGIGTDSGCFGPNNEVYRYWNEVDDQLRRVLGTQNDLYRAFVLYKNNVAAPGPNHEFVRAANTVLGDIRRGGLGPNNDLVKAANTIGEGLASVGAAVSKVFSGIRF